MTTVNISLPLKLRSQAEALIEEGLYVSFSDLVRDALRGLVARNRFDLWAQEAKKDLEGGKAVVLNSSREVEEYLKEL